MSLFKKKQKGESKMEKPQAIWGPCTEDELATLKELAKKRQDLLAVIRPLTAELLNCQTQTDNWWTVMRQKYGFPKEAVFAETIRMFGTDGAELYHLVEEAEREKGESEESQS